MPTCNHTTPSVHAWNVAMKDGSHHLGCAVQGAGGPVASSDRLIAAIAHALSHPDDEQRVIVEPWDLRLKPWPAGTVTLLLGDIDRIACRDCGFDVLSEARAQLLPDLWDGSTIRAWMIQHLRFNWEEYVDVGGDWKLTELAETWAAEMWDGAGEDPLQPDAPAWDAAFEACETFAHANPELM